MINTIISIISFCLVVKTNYDVDTVGVEPNLSPCKGDAFPLSYRPNISFFSYIIFYVLFKITHSAYIYFKSKI